MADQSLKMSDDSVDAIRIETVLSGIDRLKMTHNEKVSAIYGEIAKARGKEQLSDADRSDIFSRRRRATLDPQDPQAAIHSNPPVLMQAHVRIAQLPPVAPRAEFDGDDESNPPPPTICVSAGTDSDKKNFVTVTDPESGKKALFPASHGAVFDCVELEKLPATQHDLAGFPHPPENKSDAVVGKHFGEKVLERGLAGENSLLLIYGVTGSRKTHTAISIVNYIVQNCFEKLQGDARNVGLSAFCINKGYVHDLLAESDEAFKSAQKPFLDTEGMTYRAKCKEHVLAGGDVGMFMALSDQASSRLSTLMKPSAAHTFFSLRLMQNDAQMHIVFLGGSEQPRDPNERSAASSLAALSNVLSALAKKQHFVPWRESGLTRMLMGKLNAGNIHFVFHFCPSNYKESIATARFMQKVMEMEYAPKLRLEKIEPEIVKKHVLEENAMEISAAEQAMWAARK